MVEVVRRLEGYPDHAIRPPHSEKHFGQRLGLWRVWLAQVEVARSRLRGGMVGLIGALSTDDNRGAASGGYLGSTALGESWSKLAAEERRDKNGTKMRSPCKDIPISQEGINKQERHDSFMKWPQKKERAWCSHMEAGVEAGAMSLQVSFPGHQKPASSASSVCASGTVPNLIMPPNTLTQTDSSQPTPAHPAGPPPTSTSGTHIPAPWSGGTLLRGRLTCRVLAGSLAHPARQKYSSIS